MNVLRTFLMVLITTAAGMAQTKLPTRPADEKIRIWEQGDWKGELPNGWKIEGPEKSEVTQHMGGTTVIKNISVPLLEYFKPSGDKPAKRAVMICPGGGYNILAWDLEGTEIATWLSGNGFHAFVLKYRLPKGNDVRHAAALEDAQRAISVVRSRAEAWGIAPDQIGIMGFSAGAHLSAMAATHHAKRTYAAKDAIDAVSCRPDFVGLIYSAYFLAEAENPAAGLSKELPIDKDTPPAFLAHTMDDPLPCAGPAAWLLAMQKLKIPAELHIYPDGGHGYGLRSDKSVNAWASNLLAWLGRGAGKGN
ncbi:MAG TPA: alpha/beta hydrolase [Verrucomicrobiales bacterium]|nr:alpha/beta hydrolase [Verrucomicrobiales bacterium]